VRPIFIANSSLKRRENIFYRNQEKRKCFRRRNYAATSVRKNSAI
jgi:hypothetical protein